MARALVAYTGSWSGIWSRAPGGLWGVLLWEWECLAQTSQQQINLYINCIITSRGAFQACDSATSKKDFVTSAIIRQFEPTALPRERVSFWNLIVWLWMLLEVRWDRFALVSATSATLTHKQQQQETTTTDWAVTAYPAPVLVLYNYIRAPPTALSAQPVRIRRPWSAAAAGLECQLLLDWSSGWPQRKFEQCFCKK